MTTRLPQGTPFGAQPNVSQHFNASETVLSDPFSFVHSSPSKSGLGPPSYLGQSTQPNIQIGGQPPGNKPPLPTSGSYQHPPQASSHPAAQGRVSVVFPADSSTTQPSPPLPLLPTGDTQAQATNDPRYVARSSFDGPPPPPLLSHHGRSTSVPTASILFSGLQGDGDIFSTALSSKSNLFLPTSNAQSHPPPPREAGSSGRELSSGQPPEVGPPTTNPVGLRRASYTDMEPSISRLRPPSQGLSLPQPPPANVDGDSGVAAGGSHHNATAPHPAGEDASHSATHAFDYGVTSVEPHTREEEEGISREGTDGRSAAAIEYGDMSVPYSNTATSVPYSNTASNTALGSHGTDFYSTYGVGGEYGSVSLPRSDQEAYGGKTLEDSYELGSEHEELNQSTTRVFAEETTGAGGEEVGGSGGGEEMGGQELGGSGRGGDDSHTSSPAKSVVSLLNNDEDFAALSPVKLLPPAAGPQCTPPHSAEDTSASEQTQGGGRGVQSTMHGELVGGRVASTVTVTETASGVGVNRLFTMGLAEEIEVHPRDTSSGPFEPQLPFPLWSDQQPSDLEQVGPQHPQSLQSDYTPASIQALWSRPPHAVELQPQPLHTQPLQTQPPSSKGSVGAVGAPQAKRDTHQGQTPTFSISSSSAPHVTSKFGPDAREGGSKPSVTSQVTHTIHSQQQTSGGPLSLFSDAARAEHSGGHPHHLPPSSEKHAYGTGSHALDEGTTISLHHQTTSDHFISERGPLGGDQIGSDPQREGLRDSGSGQPKGYPLGPEQPRGYPPGPEQPRGYPSGPEQPRGYSSGPELPRGYPSGPEQPRGYPSGPEQPRGYPSGPEQPRGYSSGPEQPKGYSSGPEQPRGYSSGPEQPRGYPSGPEQPRGYPSGPEQPRGYASGPEQPRGYSSGPEQPRGYSSGPEQPKDYPSGPEQPRGYPSGPEQPRGYSSGPEQPKGYSSAPEQPRGYSSGPEQPRGYSSAPEQPRGYSSGPEQPRGYLSGPEQPRGYPSGPEQPRGYPSGPEQPRGYPSGPQPPRVSSTGPEPSRHNPLPPETGYPMAREVPRGHPTGPELPPREEYDSHRNSGYMPPPSSSEDHYRQREAHGDRYNPPHPGHGQSQYPPYLENESDYYRPRAGGRYPLDDWGYGPPSRYYAAPSDWYYYGYEGGYGDPYFRGQGGYDPYEAYYRSLYDYADPRYLDPRYVDPHGAAAYNGGQYEGPTPGGEQPLLEGGGRSEEGLTFEASSIYGNQGNFEETRVDGSTPRGQQQQTSSHFDMSDDEAGNRSYVQYEEMSKQQLETTSREMSSERQLSATPPVPRRGTPEMFYNPHVTARFGIGGHLVVVLPDVPSMGQCGIVEIHSLCDLMGVSEEEEGDPFVPGETPKSLVVRHAQTEAERCHDSARVAEEEEGKRLAEDEALMWDFLVLLCQQNGVLVPSDVADLLLSDDKEGAHHLSKMYSQSKHVGTNLEDALDEFRRRLLAGRRKDALELACTRCLWGHALMLSSGMDEQSRTYVVNRFTASLATPDPLFTFYTLLLGRTPSSVRPEGLQRAGNWRPHLAMILTNQNSKAESAAILSLGDALLAQGSVCAAHLCYLLAHVQLGAYGDEGARYSLLGVRQAQLSVSSSATMEACPSSFQLRMTEVYEYAMTLGKQDFALPAFQTYKYLHMLRLVERGLVDRALLYCESIAHAVVKCPHDYGRTMLLGLVDFSTRLHYATSPAGLVGENLPGWIVRLQQVVTKISSSSSSLGSPGGFAPSPAARLWQQHGPVPVLDRENLPENNPQFILGLGQYLPLHEHAKEGSTRASSRTEHNAQPPGGLGTHLDVPGHAEEGPTSQPPSSQQRKEAQLSLTTAVSKEMEAGSHPAAGSVTGHTGQPQGLTSKYSNEDNSGQTMFNPAQPQMTFNPAQPQMTFNPAQPQMTFNPAQPQMTFNPAQPQMTFNPAQPQMTFNPAQPQMTFNPAQPQMTFNPAQPQMTFNPAQPQMTFNPAQRQMTFNSEQSGDQPDLLSSSLTDGWQPLNKSASGFQSFNGQQYTGSYQSSGEPTAPVDPGSLPSAGVSYGQEQGQAGNMLASQQQEESSGGRRGVGTQSETQQQSRASHDPDAKSHDRRGVEKPQTAPSSKPTPQAMDRTAEKKTDSKPGQTLVVGVVVSVWKWGAGCIYVDVSSYNSV